MRSENTQAISGHSGLRYAGHQRVRQVASAGVRADSSKSRMGCGVDRALTTRHVLQFVGSECSAI